MRTVTIRKIGNSLGVIIPSRYLEMAGFKRGDVLELDLEFPENGAYLMLSKIKVIT